jgi:hypothetical protein
MRAATREGGGEEGSEEGRKEREGRGKKQKF